MKNILLLFAQCIIVTLGMSQPTLENFWMYSVGDEFKYKRIINTDEIPDNIPTVTEYHTWDFSHLLIEDSLQVNTIIDYSAANPAYNTSYPGCDFVLNEYNGIQQFFKISDDTLFHMGSGINGTPYSNTPPFPFFINPFPYESQFLPTTQTVNFPGGSYNVTNSGYYKAYGELVLPNNQIFTNVGLIHYEQIAIDSSNKVTSYYWLRSNDKNPLFRIEYNQNGNNPPTINAAYINVDIVSNTNEKVGKSQNIEFSPNPVENILEITLPFKSSLIEIEIINSVGTKISNFNYQSVKNIQIDFANLNTGLYFLIIRNGKEISTLKIMKK